MVNMPNPLPGKSDWRNICMKKFLSLLLVMLMALSLAACGGSNDAPAANNLSLIHI